MSVSIDLCERQRRVTVAVTSAEAGTPVTDQVEKAILARPALKHWDWIVDLRNQGPSPPWNVPRLRALMDSPPELSHTVIVTGDPAAEAWVRILNSQFRSRRHWVASTPGAAAALLDARSAGYCRLSA